MKGTVPMKRCCVTSTQDLTSCNARGRIAKQHGMGHWDMFNSYPRLGLQQTFYSQLTGLQVQNIHFAPVEMSIDMSHVIPISEELCRARR